MTPFEILKLGFDEPLAKAITDSYAEIEQNYALGKWKPSELDAGHFVEAVRRAIDFELTGSYLRFGRSLPSFDDAALKGYENASGDESFRVLIPRALKAVYNIRNRRGVAHISVVNPNEMDANYIMYSVKWVLAELVRIKSGLGPDETQRLVDAVVERQSVLVWKDGGVICVLDAHMTARDQTIVLLYDESPRKDADLRRIIGYTNSTNFLKILSRLHKSKLIYYESGSCRLTPLGVIKAEEIVRGRQLS